MKFTKMQGLGNDYIYVNCLEEEVLNPCETARKLSNRNFGIGSDGLILIEPSELADFRMSMYNADGSEGKTCGNGIRCVAKYLYEHRLTDRTAFSIETKGGIKYPELIIKDRAVEAVQVEMGSPVTKAASIPVLSEKEQLIAEGITILDQEYEMTCISMGNPHAVVFVEKTDGLAVDEIGPAFEQNGMFPEGVNTEFVQVLDRKSINMRVWERGSGETLACGTGACAAAFACILNHRTEDEVCVHLLGGDLDIRYDRAGNIIYMTGPAVTVFEGETRE